MYRVLAWITALVVSGGVVRTEAPVGPEISAPSAVLMEASTGQIIYEKNGEEQRSPASITKIMTLILIFDALQSGKIRLTDEVVTSAHAKSMGGSQVFLEEGEIQTVETLIKCIVIASGNDASVAMAEFIGGDEGTFVKMMNEEAVQIGATGTHFANANGLTNADHYMTAYDLYLMFHEALKYEKFRDIIGTKTYTASYKGADGSDKTASWSVSNYYMLGKKEMPEGLSVFGGKTGTTQAAGYCLIMGERDADGKEYASVVMHADSRDALYSDMSTIMEKIDR